MLVATVELIISGLTLVVFVDVILSFVLNPFHPVRRALDSVVEPMLAPIRRLIPPVGMFDFSAFIFLILVQVLATILMELLS